MRWCWSAAILCISSWRALRLDLFLCGPGRCAFIGSPFDTFGVREWAEGEGRLVHADGQALLEQLRAVAPAMAASSFRMPPPASPRARPLNSRGCNPLVATCSTLPTVGGAQVCRAGSVGPAATLGWASPWLLTGSSAPARVTASQAAASAPWLHSPSLQSAAPCRLSEGPKSAALDDGHGNIGYISSMWSMNSRGWAPPGLLFLTPAVTALRDSAGAVFCELPLSGGALLPLAATSGRRQYLSGSSLGLVGRHKTRRRVRASCCR